MSKKISGSIRANCYDILSRAIEEGVTYGWQRAHKHTDTPSTEQVCEEIKQAVMNAISEVFFFDDSITS